jgi:YHS domain-containing protein
MLSQGISIVTTSLLGLGSALAQDAHHDHMTATQVTESRFMGDAYLLSVDPVSGDPLSDKPIVSMHEGRELRFANQKSLDVFKLDPGKYLTKVDQQMIAYQLPFYPLDICMVSGDKLGGDMGKPVELIYKNRLVRFCCTGCVTDFNKDPNKFISKLNEAVIAKQEPSYPLTSCVVSGQKLGDEMGKPVDLVIGNRLVRLCCTGCINDFNKNPTKFLKMIDDAAQKKAADTKQGPSDGAAKSPDHGGHQH